MPNTTPGGRRDPSVVDPSWAPPADPPAGDSTERQAPILEPAHSRRTWVITAAIVFTLTAALVAMWALGGFERRTDLLRPTTPGTMVTTGPYELTFTEVTAQRKKSFSDELYWEITAVGTGRTTGNISIAPNYGETGTFVSKDLRSGEIEIPDAVQYGTGDALSSPTQFTPGLPPIPIRVRFNYADTYAPQPTLLFVVFRLEYSDRSLLGGQDPTWNKTTSGFDYRLPVRVLPAQTT